MTIDHKREAALAGGIYGQSLKKMGILTGSRALNYHGYPSSWLATTGENQLFSNQATLNLVNPRGK